MFNNSVLNAQYLIINIHEAFRVIFWNVYIYTKTPKRDQNRSMFTQACTDISYVLRRQIFTWLEKCLQIEKDTERL